MENFSYQFKLIDLARIKTPNPLWGGNECGAPRTGQCGQSAEWPRMFTIYTDRAWRWTSRDHGRAVVSECVQTRTVRGQGLDTDTDKSQSRSIGGPDTDLFADRRWKWAVRGHGQTTVVVADGMRTRLHHSRGCGLCKFAVSSRTYLRMVRGRGLCADTDKLCSWSRAGYGHGLTTGAAADWT